MTAASELKSAAVVLLESRKRKTPGQTSAKTDIGVIGKESKKAISRAVIKSNIGEHGSNKSKAASIQATRLPVSVFSKNSRIFPSPQNPVPPRHIMPGRMLRAGRAA